MVFDNETLLKLLNLPDIAIDRVVPGRAQDAQYLHS
jgi:hypothetical protein